MARKTADTGIPASIDWDEDATFEGHFVGIQYGIPSQYGDFNAATLQEEDGTKRSAVLTVDLGRGLESVPLGSRVWITYTGKERLANGNSVKRFTVDYDDEDRIEVARQAPAPSPAASAPAAPKGTAYDEEPF